MLAADAARDTDIGKDAFGMDVSGANLSIAEKADCADHHDRLKLTSFFVSSSREGGPATWRPIDGR